MDEQGPALPPRPKDYWIHRRRLAYVNEIALLSMLAAMYLDRIPAGLADLAGTLAWIFAFLVSVYYGNTAAEAFANRGKK